MSRERRNRVLMVAWDAAEPGLVERWTEDGTLPNLTRLRERGAYGRLASTADWLAGSPWPTFYTGRNPGEHGLYHAQQWRADLMRYARPTPDWVPARPFWRALGRAGPRVVAVDLPMTFAPEPFHGVEVSGWATHDCLMPPASYPAEVLAWVRRAFGASPIREEVFTPQPLEALLGLREELVRATQRVADLAVALMSRDAWDLFLVGFGATHRGGHRLWDVSSLVGEDQPGDRDRLFQALRSVYVACDGALGRIATAAGDGVTTLVFSLHGMGPNTSRAELLPAMLGRILADEERSGGAAQPPGLLRRLRSMVPLSLRQGVKRRLPQPLQDRLSDFWRLGGTDWSRTPALALLADLQGYVRINLRGREAAGVVEPGGECDRLCTEIAEGLSTFVDAESGEAVVESVTRSEQVFQGRCLPYLPDLLVRWRSTPAAAHRAIVSPRYGTVTWPLPDRNADGRSGNHRPQGFLVATGSGIRSGSRIEAGHILDLAPSACALLGTSPPLPMEGTVLEVVA